MNVAYRIYGTLILFIVQLGYIYVGKTKFNRSVQTDMA